MLNYVVSEQKNPDWVFKSSYIYIKENNLPLSQDQLYIPDQIDNIIDYIIDTKPYHTQIRDYSSTYVTSDIAIGTAIDSYNINITLQFGPDYAGDTYIVPSYVLDAQLFANNIQQFVSQENVYTVPLTFYDISKKGYSQLFPYTFDFSSLGSGGFVPATNIVGVQIGASVLIAGQDFYVEYNIDTTYTAYFFNDPTTGPTPVALVWFDGGQLLTMYSDTYRDETAKGFATDDFVVNVDTRLPVNDVSAINLVPPFAIQPTVAPYVGWGDIWEAVVDPVASILVAAGGTAEIPWDTPLKLLVLSDTISSKENLNTYDGSVFYRNSEAASGNLVFDLPAPTESTQNLDVITIFVDPLTHPLGTDILPEPSIVPGVIWINGERIEYKNKQMSAPNTWELRLVARGTNGTSATNHPALVPTLANPLIFVPNIVFVEKDNIMPVNSNIEIWNVLEAPAIPDLSTEGPAGEFTNVVNIPLGGLWYAQTSEAVYLKAGQGISIP
jgi:hypothetical protein